MRTDAQALYEKGLELFQEDQLDDAEHQMRRAIEVNPLYEDAHEALGVILGRRGRIDEAIAVTLTLAEINPDHLMAHVNLSVFYNKKGGMIEEAEAEQAKARILGWREELRRNKETGMVGSSTTIEPEAAGAPPEPNAAPGPRRETFLEVLKIDAEDAVANFSLGKLYLEEEEYEQARDHLSTVVRVQEDYSAAYPLLGQAQEALGEVEAALVTYTQGIAVAGRRGDLKPLQLMEKRLAALNSDDAPHSNVGTQEETKHK